MFSLVLTCNFLNALSTLNFLRQTVFQQHQFSHWIFFDSVRWRWKKSDFYYQLRSINLKEKKEETSAQGSPSQQTFADKENTRISDTSSAPSVCLCPKCLSLHGETECYRGGFCGVLGAASSWAGWAVGTDCCQGAFLGGWGLTGCFQNPTGCTHLVLAGQDCSVRCPNAAWTLLVQRARCRNVVLWLLRPVGFWPWYCSLMDSCCCHWNWMLKKKKKIKMMLIRAAGWRPHTEAVVQHCFQLGPVMVQRARHPDTITVGSAVVSQLRVSPTPHIWSDVKLLQPWALV